MSDVAGARTRALAARINARVVSEGISLERALSEAPTPPDRDTGLMRSLSSGALRWHHRLEWQAAELLSRPLRKRDAELAALLRIGLLQLQVMRIPDHAAVSATVAAADLVGAGHAKGLVNAVLRRFLREREELDKRMENVPSAAMSHPDWMLERFRSDWPDAWQDIVAANNSHPPMWLRVNRLKSSREEYLAKLEAADIEAEPGTSDAAIMLAEPRPAGSLPGFGEGLVSVQDGAAQLAVGYLDLAPGQRVLDVCAAPGGKSAHILEACPELRELTVIDRDGERMRTLETAFSRLGHSATIVVGDANDPAKWWDGRGFDRILLDAPCSALGVIRRHPDIKLLRRRKDIDGSVVSQKRLLKSVWPLLVPGGMLLYAVCTIAAAETTGQLAGFLAETSDAALVGPVAGQDRQILPGEANMDGFYYACIHKNE
ncbi:MAG TPA: 16S rRNA (cytosine(967)-C(5))-methyltransferase RsmB [Gammaproteobacteria bacterium]